MSTPSPLAYLCEWSPEEEVRHDRVGVALSETPDGGAPAQPPPSAPSFIAAPDAWETPTIWSADPDRPAVLLQRQQLGVGPAADALWDLIVGAVEGAGR